MRVGNGNACCAFEFGIEATLDRCQLQQRRFIIIWCEVGQFERWWQKGWQQIDEWFDGYKAIGCQNSTTTTTRATTATRVRKARKPHAKGLKTNTNRKVKQKQQQTEIEIEMHNNNSNNNKKNYLGQTHFWQGQRNAKPQPKKPNNNNSTANIRKTRNRNRKNSPRDDGNCCCLRCCCWCCCCCTQLAIIKCNWFETWLVNGYANRLCLIVRCNWICSKGETLL